MGKPIKKKKKPRNHSKHWNHHRTEEGSLLGGVGSFGPLYTKKKERNKKKELIITFPCTPP